MPNKKLQQKLAAKASKVQAIMVEFPKAHAIHIGKKAYQKLRGSYGNTINPYKKYSIQHREFRLGFNDERKKLQAKPVLQEGVPV